MNWFYNAKIGTKLLSGFTAGLVQEISAASREQDSGAEQINRAIQQLDA
ncbi:hypothetical protein [Citrifermentans bremense]|nr:hypothetical protein [Citrifermentans bremense]